MKHDFKSTKKPFFNSGRWTIIATIIVALAISGACFRYVFQFQRNPLVSTSTLAKNTPTIRAVSALGHIIPEGEVIHLSAPTVFNGLGTSRVSQLLVKEGDKVKTGQLIAILDDRDSLQAVLGQALAQVKVAKANLAKVEAGAKIGEIEAQKATIADLKADLQGQRTAQNKTVMRLKAELYNGQVEYERYYKLFQNGAVTASQLDSKQLTMKVAQEQLGEAQANLHRIATTFQQKIKAAQDTMSQIAEIRPTDIQAAKSEVSKALADVTKAKADLDLAYIRSPINGQVLNIYARPGEVVTDRGIVALGQTTRMNVVAEVYESDIGKLQVGQKAIITSNSFSGQIHGRVTKIGLQVNPQTILSTDPSANVDARIIDIKIGLDPADRHKVSTLTNLQVNVVISV